MLRRLNFRFAIGLVVVLSAAGFGLAALHRRQVTRQVAELPRLADRAEADGKQERAIRFLNMYLAKVPADAAVRLRLAEALGRQAQTPYHFRQVMAEFERALAADPSHPGLRQKLVELYFAQRSYKEALGHAEALEAAAPNDPLALDWKGRCQAALGENERAVESFRRAVAAPTALLETFTRLAATLDRLKKPEEAGQVVEQMVARFPNSHAAYLKRAAFFLERSKADPEAKKRVKSDFAKAIELAPEDADVLLLSSGLAQESGDRVVAKTYLARGVELYPKDPRFYAALAQLEMAAGRTKEAIALLKAGAPNLGDRVDTTLMMAELFLRLGGTSEARDTLKMAGNRLPPLESVRARVIEARIAMADRDWAKAYRGLEVVRSQMNEATPKTAEIDLDLAICAANLGLNEQRYSYARRAVKVAGNDPTARYALATALMSLNRVDEAAEVLRPLADIPNIADPVLLEYAKVLLAKMRKGGANAQSASYVDAVLKKLDERKSISPEVPILRAESLLVGGDQTAARQVIDAAREKTPGELSLWVATATLESLSGGPPAAGLILNQAQARIGDSIALRLARLRLEYDPADPKGGGLLDRIADGIDQFPSAGRIAVLLRLAEINSRSRGRIPVSSQQLAEIIRLRPTEIGSWLYLCDIAAQIGDADALAIGGANVRRLEGPGGRLGRYAEAALLVLQVSKGDKSVAAQARSLIEQLTNLDSGSPRPFLLAAGLEKAEGNDVAVTANLLKAVGLGDRSPNVVRLGVEQLIAQRRYAEADNLVRSLPPDSLPSDLRRKATEISLQLDDNIRAIDLASKSAKNEEITPEDLHWQAYVFIAAGKPAEAERALRDAIRRGGKPECHVALVQLLAGTPGAAVRAREAVFALEAGAATQDALLAAGECRQILGDQAKADEHFKAALKVAPDDPKVLSAVAAQYATTGRFPQAEPHLRRLVTRSVPVKPEAVASARRELAAGLSADGVWLHAQEALALLDANDKEFPNDQANSAARAYVFSKVAGRRKEAIRIYEELRSKQSLNASQLQTLAALYDYTGQWLKARSVYQQQLGDGGRASPDDLARAVDRYLVHGDPDGAAGWLRRLRNVEPNSLRSLALSARADAKRKQRGEATQKLASAAADSTADRALLARTWEEIGEPGKAEGVLKGDPTAGSISVLSLISLYGRTGAVPKALEISERALRDGFPPDAVIAVALDAVRGQKMDPTVYDRIDHLLMGAGNKVRWALYFRAGIRQEQGRYQEAAALLDQFLVDQPDNAMALVRRGWLALLHDAKPSEAARFADAAMAAHGPQTSALVLKSAAFAVAGKVDEAQRVLDLSDGDGAEVSYRLAQLAITADRRREAVEYLRAALDAGLSERDLHPLERPLFKTLTAKLALRP